MRSSGYVSAFNEITFFTRIVFNNRIKPVQVIIAYIYKQTNTIYLKIHL